MVEVTLEHRTAFWDQVHTADPLLALSKLCDAYREKHGRKSAAIKMHPETFTLLAAADSTQRRIAAGASLDRVLLAYDLPPITQDTSAEPWLVKAIGQDDACCLRVIA